MAGIFIGIVLTAMVIGDKKESWIGSLIASAFLWYVGWIIFGNLERWGIFP